MSMCVCVCVSVCLCVSVDECYCSLNGLWWMVSSKSMSLFRTVLLCNLSTLLKPLKGVRTVCSLDCYPRTSPLIDGDLHGSDMCIKCAVVCKLMYIYVLNNFNE